MRIILIVFLSLMIFSCKKESKNNQKNKEKIEETTVAINDGHSSEVSLDWEGSYFGILPCASCSGIKTFITLNSNNTYEKVTEYLEADSNSILERGNFSWSEDGCNIILNNNKKTTFKVGENALFMLDKNGEITSEELANNHTLKKTQIKNCTDIEGDGGYYLHFFKGDDNVAYSILYNTSKKTPTALVQTEKFSKELTQTEAWAKGAEYKSGNYKLVAKGDKISLFINDKEVKLEVVK